MDVKKALSIIDALANGVNPMTGECVDEDSLLSQPEVIRAFFTVLNDHAKLQACATSVKTLPYPAPKPQKPRAQIEQEKRQYNIANGHPACHGFPWTSERIQDVIKQYLNNVDIEVIAKEHARKPTSIINILQKNHVIDSATSIILAARIREQSV